MSTTTKTTKKPGPKHPWRKAQGGLDGIYQRTNVSAWEMGYRSFERQDQTDVPDHDKWHRWSQGIERAETHYGIGFVHRAESWEGYVVEMPTHEVASSELPYCRKCGRPTQPRFIKAHSWGVVGKTTGQSSMSPVCARCAAEQKLPQCKGCGTVVRKGNVYCWQCQQAADEMANDDPYGGFAHRYTIRGRK